MKKKYTIAGNTRANNPLPIKPTFWGPSFGRIDALHTPTTRPIKARVWAYLGSQNRVRAQNTKKPIAPRTRSTTCKN